MGVSKNNGTSKSSILIGFSLINHPFWGFSPYFWVDIHITPGPYKVHDRPIGKPMEKLIGHPTSPPLSSPRFEAIGHGCPPCRQSKYFQAWKTNRQGSKEPIKRYVVRCCKESQMISEDYLETNSGIMSSTPWNVMIMWGNFLTLMNQTYTTYTLWGPGHENKASGLSSTQSAALKVVPC